MPNAQAAIVIMMLTTSAEIWRQWRRRLKANTPIFPESESPIVPVNLIAIVLTVAMIGLSLVSVLLPSRAVATAEKIPSIKNVWDGCLLNSALVLVLFPIVVGGRFQSLAGLGFGLANCRRQFMDGMQTALASFIPVLLVLLVTSPFRTPQGTHPLLLLLKQDGHIQTFAAVVLAAVVLAPLAEELMFRVVLLGWLKTRASSTEAIVISSIAFAAVHGPLDGLALVPLALLLGYLYDRRRSFWSVFVAHAFFNLTNIVLAMSSR